MNRSQSWKRIPSDEAAEFKEDKRATSHPNLSHSSSLSTAELRGTRYSTEDLRRKIVSLNKELETERAFVKQLRREKSIDLKHAREEEQRRAASMQTELKTKLHKEKTNELTALKEQIHKDKEKEILQIIKQKDDALRSAQQSWGKEKDELRGKLRGEIWSEAREESRKEFDRERTRLEQEILDLKMQKKELEEAYKTLQESDKRKADEIRRIFHEHEMALEKFKRNSWQESRRQMGEIRQLLNIIEQLERKLGIDSGHINKLRMEKEGLFEELRKKTNTFDAWDSMMSSSLKSDSGSTAEPIISPSHTDPKYHGVSLEIRTLQRKNTELSSLVKKLDEKNQQLATKNAELLSELERSDKETKDKCKKLEKKNLDITQNTKKLESKNKALQDEINALKRKPGPSSGKDVGSKKGVRPRGQGTSQTDGPEIATLKQQIKEQSKTIEELKQNLVDKERRIDLLKQRKKSGKKQKFTGRTSVDAVLQQEHDDAASGVSDVSSDISEMSSTDSSSDASKLKKLTKELLALERAYALLQAQVGGTVDVERDELERQQLQSDLIESQTRIHELERMMDNNAQGGSEDLQHLQHDNKILYQKLIAAENERDKALNELSKNTEDFKDLQDKKDLLEFELEEMSQMSFAGSEDEFASPRKMRDKEDRKLPLSLEEVKAYLEEMENEKANVLTVMELEALKQARTSLTALPQKISHLEATETVLRSKVKDLEERHLLDSQGASMLTQIDSHMGEPETLSEVLELDAANKDQTDSTQNNTDFTLLDIDKHFQEKRLIDKECVTELTSTLLCDMERIYEKFLRDYKQEAESLCPNPIITIDAAKNDAECMTDFIWEDIVEIEETYQEFLTNIEGLELNLAKAGAKMVDKRTTTDLLCEDITALENKGKQLDQLQVKDVEKHEQESNTDLVQCFDRESNTEVIEKHEIECNTELTCDDMVREQEKSRAMILKVDQLESELSKTFSKKNDMETMTDVAWKDVVKQEELYKKQIEELQDLLVMEQELRKADEMKLVEYEMLKEANAARKTAEISVMTDDVVIEEPEEQLKRMVQDVVVKSKHDAVAEIAGESIDDLQHCLFEKLSICQTDQQIETDVTGEYMETLQTSNETNASELTRLIKVAKEREKRFGELQEDLVITRVEKDELEAMADHMREEYSEREGMLQRHIDELHERLSMEEQVRQTNEMKLLEYETLKEANMARLHEDKNIMTDMVRIVDTDEVFERTAREIVEKSMNKACLEVANDIICHLRNRLAVTSDKGTITVQDTDGVLERTAREIVEKSMNKACLEVANDIICDLQNRPAIIKTDKETITDVLDEDLQNMEKDNQKNILELEKMRDVVGQNKQMLRELENELCKVFDEKKDLEVVIDMMRKDVSEKDQLHEEHVKKLQEQIVFERAMREADKIKLVEHEDKIYEDKLVMTESILVVDPSEMLERMVRQTVQEAKNEAIVEVANEDLEDIIQNEIREMEIWRNLVKDREQNLNQLETELSKNQIERNELQTTTDLLREEFLSREKLYKDQIDELKEQLSIEQDVRDNDKMKLVEAPQDETHCQRTKVESIVTTDEILTCDKDSMTDMSWVEVIQIEEKYEEFRDNIQEIQEKLAKVDVAKDEVEVMTDLVWEDLCNQEQLYKEQIEEMQEQLVVEREMRETEKMKLLEYKAFRESSMASPGDDKSVMTDNVCIKKPAEVLEDIVRGITKDATNKALIEVTDEKLQYMIENEMLNESRFRENEQKLRDLENKLSKSKINLQLMADQMKEDVSIREQLEQFYRDQINKLQEQLIMEQDMRKVLERETREELQEKLAKVDVAKDEVEVMTDLVWEDLCNQERLYKEQIEEMQEQLVVEREMREADKMKLLEYEALRESSVTVPGDDKSVMTDQIYIKKPAEVLQSVVVELVEQAKSEAIVELMTADALLEVAKEDKEIMTEFSWKEIEYLEKTYREWVEELRQMKDDLRRQQLERKDKSCMTELTTTGTIDVEMMTDLEWTEIIHLESSYNKQILELQALKDAKINEEKTTMTELKWEDIVYLETSYTEKLVELEVIAEGIKDVEHRDPRADAVDNKAMTDLSWQDIEHLENSYKEELEKLEVLAESLKDNEKEGRDEEVMTDMKWDEVQSQLESYKQQIDNLNGLLAETRYHGESLFTETVVSVLEGENMGQLPWSMDIDDKEDTGNLQDGQEENLDIDIESTMDLNSTDMLTLDKLNSLVEEREDKECMTHLSHEGISAMENVARDQNERLENTEDKSCMTDLLFDDILSRLDRLQILEQQQQHITDSTDNEHMTLTSSCDLGRGQDNKELEQGQYYRMTDDDEEQNDVQDTQEPSEPRTSTRMMEFPFSEGLDGSLTREDSLLGRNVDLIDQYTSTDITLEDILYFENLEVKHHELLLKTKQQGTRSSMDGSSMDRSSMDRSSLDRSLVDGPSMDGSSMDRYSMDRSLVDGTSMDRSSMDRSLVDGPSMDRSLVDGPSMVGSSMDGSSMDRSLIDRSSVYGPSGMVDKNGRPIGLGKTDQATSSELPLEDLMHCEKLEVEHHEMMVEKKNKNQQEEATGIFSAEEDRTTVDIKEYENLKSKYEQLLEEKESLDVGGLAPGMTSISVRDYENLNDKYNKLLLEKEQWEAEHAEQRQVPVHQEDYENMKEQLLQLLMEKEQWEAEHAEQRKVPVDQEDYENMKEQLLQLLMEKEQWEAEHAEQRKVPVDQEDYENMKEQLLQLLMEKEQWEAEHAEQRKVPVDQEDYENMKEQLLQLLMEKEQWEAEHAEQRKVPVDQEDYENMKEQLLQLLMEKEQWEAEHAEQRKVPVDQEDYENMKEQLLQLLMEKEQWEAEHAEQRKVPVDQEDYENMKEQLLQLLMEKEQWEAEHAEQRKVPVDQEDYENMKEQLLQLLMEKEQWEAEHAEQRKVPVDQEDYENMKEQLLQLLMEKEQWEAEHAEQRKVPVDQEDYENMKEQLLQLLMEKEQWEAAQSEMGLGPDDRKDYENIKEKYNELLSEKEQWEDEKQQASLDQEDYDNMKEQLNGLRLEKEQWEAAQAEQRLSSVDQEDYENIKEKYNELLSEKEQWEGARLHGSLGLNELGTSTDLTLDDLEYYENLELVYRELQESHQELSLQYDAMSGDKNSTDKATGTEMNLDDIQSLQDAENEYKNLLLTQQGPPLRESKGVCTDVSMNHLQYLEEVDSIHQTCGSQDSAHVGTTTVLMLADLHYLKEVEAVHQQCMTTVDNDISSSRTDTSDMGVGTELTASVLEYLEEVAGTHKEIVREYEAFRRSVTKETEDVNVMTEVTGRHLDNLDEMAMKGEELEQMVSQLAEEKRRKEERRRDSAMMTELSLENLKNLEKSGNIYTELQDRGILSRFEQLQKPKRKYGTVTDLLVSNIEYLEEIERLYREQERLRNSMIEKSVQTDMTRSDVKRIENLANNAADTKKRVVEIVTPQASRDLLESSYPLQSRDGNSRHGDTGRYGDRGRHGDARGVGTVEIGIQCELKDLLSLIREQHEQNGSADTNWFISELNKKSKERFEPVEVVLRHGVQKSSTPDFTSRRDQGNKRYSLDSKRHSSNMSLNLDYGWQSTSSLDISAFDKTPSRGSGVGRWDSPRVPLAQDETFDLSDIESAPSEESLHHAMQTSGRGDSAVTQFDRYVMARKQSERDLLADIRENGVEEDGGPHQPKSMAELLNENERLRIRNMELELLVSQKGDLSDDELELLKQKIQQLREAEEQMEKLHHSNTALKDRINQLQEENLPSGPSTSRSAQDNWSEMDPSEGRTRLLLVQDWGLGESDLDSLFSAREGAVSPAESIETSALRRLLHEYVKSDHATQAGPAPGVSQEIQTTEDLVKLIDLSYDGTIPDHIAQELEKLKAENKELYQELLELRKLKLENSTAAKQGSRDRPEEPIRASVQSTAEAQNDLLTKLDALGDGRSGTRRDDRDKPKVHVNDFDELFAEPAPKPQPARRQYSNRKKVKEPEILSSRSNRDTKAVNQKGLRNLDVMDGRQDVRQRSDTDDILDFEFGDDAPPDFAPPPVPSEPPPDLPDDDHDDMELETETILGSSPPRDSRSLRAASRQKNYPAGIASLSEPDIQVEEGSNVEGEPVPGRTEIPPALRTNQTSPLHRGMTKPPPATSKPAPPPTLPKPKMSGRRLSGTTKHGLLSTQLSRSRESLNDEEALGLTPRGYVRATASAINQGELDALGEKINFLEKQLKNKENVIRSMKAEASELEKQALLERREREIKILEDDVAFLKQENHKKERELLTKIGELNRKSYEADQWKSEANNAEKQRKRIEMSYLNLQAQTRTLQGSDSKLTGLQSKYTTLEKENKQLTDKVKNLEKTEKEFKQLEYNISVLQNHLQDMESVEKERDDLLKKLQIVEDQRDDLLKKGRMVESERNDFLRNNKIMEMQRDELEQRYAMAHKNQVEMKAAADEMEDQIQDAKNKTLDAQHERNFVQAQYNKLEGEKADLEKRLAAVSQERNSLETQLAELEDRSREYVKLEDGFHTLRLKAAELTRQKDDFEMQIQTLKAKVAILKKACKEKDEFIDKLNDEIRELRHAIATSTLDDLSKIRSYGYSPENFVKYSGKKKDKTRSAGDAVDAKPRSNGRPSPKSKSRNPHPQLFVAIFDYDPHKASVSGCPESELTLKEGDQLTVYGDMDSNGCYEAELNGVRGLVPGLYVEEVEDGPVHSLANGTNEHENERNAKRRLTNGHYEADAISSGHSSMSPRSSCPDTELQRQCYVALYDYNPYQSCTTGRPELELPLKKGDIMTVIGEMDDNGYYKADMDGRTGLVPSNFVEDVTSSSFLQPTSSTAPEQILGMLDNIKVPSPQRSGTSLPLPMPMLPNTEPSFPSHPATVNIVPSGHVGQPIPSVTMVSPRREQAIQPIFTPYMSPAEVHKLAAPISSTHPNKTRAKTSQRSPRQQTASSPRHGMTSQLSPSKHPISSQPMTSPPQITSQVQRSSVQPVNKPKPRQSKGLVTSSQSIGHRGPPSPPSSLRVLRPVNHDAILLGWSLPDMDEFGRSNGVVVKGYKIYENGDYKMDVRSQFMTKALVDDLDLRYPILLTIRTIGSDGSHSSDVSTTFTDTINHSRMSVSKAIEGTVGNNKQVRIFVALYDYDPMKSSPNSNPQYELKFNEGDILRIEDTSRKDGFYFGSLNDKKGLIPSNFVEEVAIAIAPGSPSPSRKDGSRAITNGDMNGTSSPSPTPRHRKKMIALYDYNPNEQSPLDNHHNELSFTKGQEVTVTGTMDKDGYYNAEINGRKGLVPASFLETSTNDTTSRVSPGTNKKYRS